MFWYIWQCRNSVKFNSKSVPIRSAIHLIIAATSLSGNYSKGHMNSSMDEFAPFKFFFFFLVFGHYSKALSIIQVNWYPPLCGWIKCNFDGAARGNPGQAASGGIFRDNSAAILGYFSSYTGITNSFTAEL